jgi:putative tryptophan/tyrosine transport system substrate-binding protein
VTLTAVRETSARGADPVGYGIVTNLARPGSHITGVSYLGVELNPKRLELLKEALPKLSLVAVLVNPTHVAYPGLVRNLESPANALGLQLRIVEVRAAGEFDRAFDTMVRMHVGAVIVLQHHMFALERKRIAELALKSRLPTTYEFRQFVQDGGFMS